MSLQPHVVYLIPEDTAHLARTIFPKADNPRMQMRDRLGMIAADRCPGSFAHPSPSDEPDRRRSQHRSWTNYPPPSNAVPLGTNRTES